MTTFAPTPRFAPSPNLALNEAVTRRRNAGQSLVHLGFGESQLPVPSFLSERLCAGARRNDYGEVAGALDCREAAAGYFTRRGLETGPDQVVMAPGSKPILLALMAAVDGPVILAQPCWVTYAPQARLFGREVIEVPIPPECGGVPDPDLLAATLRSRPKSAPRPKILLLTLPDNPTGTFASRAIIRRLCEIAEAEDLLIISDEIYRDILHSPDAVLTSPAEFSPDRTVITSGLSKTLALGGWRIGFSRFPDTADGRELRAKILCLASEMWSTLAGPMQEVSAYALAEPPEILAHLAQGARLHGAVAAAVHDIVVAAGARNRPPTGGFYVYPDFEPRRGELAAKGITDSESLQNHLLENLGVAVLGGHHLGDLPGALRFRGATSMIYGEDDAQRWAALGAPDPVALPHVARSLSLLDEAFQALVG